MIKKEKREGEKIERDRPNILLELQHCSTEHKTTTFCTYIVSSRARVVAPYCLYPGD
jgi:hypothetical protein